MTAQASKTARVSNAEILRRLAVIATRLDEEAHDREAFRQAQAVRADALQRTLLVQGEAIERLEIKLGEEPDSDGNGGRGVIGDLRRTAKDMRALMDLRAKGMGAIAAIGLFAAVIMLGVTHWIEGLVKGASQ